MAIPCNGNECVGRIVNAPTCIVQNLRVERTRVHVLTDILILGILSVIAGGKGWEDMENYGISKYEWLEQFLALPEGIPNADT